MITTLFCSRIDSWGRHFNLIPLINISFFIYEKIFHHLTQSHLTVIRQLEVLQRGLLQLEHWKGHQSEDGEHERDLHFHREALLALIQPTRHKLLDGLQVAIGRDHDVQDRDEVVGGEWEVLRQPRAALQSVGPLRHNLYGSVRARCFVERGCGDIVIKCSFQQLG